MSIGNREVALKYLELARGEILEKAKVVNQTLGAYLAGSAALASWFYQAVYKPVGEGVSAATDAEKAAATIGLAVLLSYLSVAVNWIIYHNERIIAALALYQRDSLSLVLADDPPMWERSAALGKMDDLTKALNMVVIEELIVLGPPLAALVVASVQAAPQICSAHWSSRTLGGIALIAALGGIAKTIQIGFQMRETTQRLRNTAVYNSARGLMAGLTFRTIPLNSDETQHN